MKGGCKFVQCKIVLCIHIRTKMATVKNPRFCHKGWKAGFNHVAVERIQIKNLKKNGGGGLTALNENLCYFQPFGSRITDNHRHIYAAQFLKPCN